MLSASGRSDICAAVSGRGSAKAALVYSSGELGSSFDAFGFPFANTAAKLVVVP